MAYLVSKYEGRLNTAVTYSSPCNAESIVNYPSCYSPSGAVNKHTQGNVLQEAASETGLVVINTEQ